MSKITLATIKRFVAKNRDNLLVKVTMQFDGMCDCNMPVKDPKWVPAKKSDRLPKETLGVDGLWITGGKNWYTEINEDGVTGYRIYNCCGSSMIGVKA